VAPGRRGSEPPFEFVGVLQLDDFYSRIDWLSMGNRGLEQISEQAILQFDQKILCVADRFRKRLNEGFSEHPHPFCTGGRRRRVGVQIAIRSFRWECRHHLQRESPVHQFPRVVKHNAQGRSKDDNSWIYEPPVFNKEDEAKYGVGESGIARQERRKPSRRQLVTEINGGRFRGYRELKSHGSQLRREVDRRISQNTAHGDGFVVHSCLQLPPLVLCYCLATLPRLRAHLENQTSKTDDSD
jgi:hypothetical protein